MTDIEIKEDFIRFVRHEAMRANTFTDRVFHIISKMMNDYGKINNS